MEEVFIGNGIDRKAKRLEWERIGMAPPEDLMSGAIWDLA
jgi:hypothetical protein